MRTKPLIIGTGLSGLVGSRLVELLQTSFDFFNLDLTQDIDITSKDQVLKAISQNQPSVAVLHLAAFTDVSKAHQQSQDKNGSVYQVNVVGTQNIVSACKNLDLYLIHVSTDFVFDGKNPPESGYSEEDKPNPIEWYGQTKLMAETLVKESGIKHSIVRLAFPFRANFAQKLDLVRTIIKSIKDNSLHPMFTDQIITPTFIDDIVKALRVIIDKKPVGIYHLVGSTPLSPFNLAQKIASTFNLKTEIKKGSFKEYLKVDPRPRQQFLKLSNQKLKNDLNVTMSTLDEALSELKKQIS